MNTKIIEPFLQGNFELDCPLIQLIPSMPKSKKSTLSGSGFISINEDGYFDLKVYFPNSFSHEDNFESLGWESGKLIGDEFYYDLVAQDISGATWYAERFILDRNSGPNGSMIIGEIPELYFKPETVIEKNKHILQLFFNEPVKVPYNTVVKEQVAIEDKTRHLRTSRRIARFKAIGIDFEVEAKEGYTVLRAVSDEIELNDILINRILEAFCFVTANSVPWSILEIRRNGEQEYRFKAVKRKRIKSKIPPPIDYRTHSNNVSVWLLFDKYLNFIVSNDAEPYHPISILFYSILESGKATVDVEALTLSVSIESILKNELGHIYELSKDLEDNINCVSKLVQESEELNNHFRERILGSIGAMKNARGKDILFALRDNELIDKYLVKTYGELRNKTAHGVRDSGADVQNFLNQTNDILVLFYQLVFLIIKYSGEYTDYGTYNYPTKTFSSKLL